MRIQELLEQTPVSSVGSAANPSTVPTVSNQPGDKPASATSSTPAADPNMQKLAATLQQTGVTKNPKEVNDFISAYQASTNGKTLNPQQQATMAKLAPAMLKDPNLDAKIKLMTAQKPGQQTAPGTAPPQ